MEITRNVILDLLPLYLADEVSADTRGLIDKYLKTDPELANVVKHSEAKKLPGDIPVPLSQEDNIKTYRKAKMLIFLHTIILAGIISISLVVAVFIFFFYSS
ncbi:hypothetical protein ACFL4T_02175 [candidate division KSB1 bacterium]